MTREDLHKAFTREQLDWLIKNGAKPEGNTDGEILANYAKLLWANRQWQGKDGAVTLNKIINGKQVSYDLQSIAQAAGFTDDPGKDGKKAADKFYEAYFGGEKDKDTRDRWRTGIYEAYGDGSWDKVRKVLQGESTNRMYANIDKTRRDILEGNAEGQDWTDWGASALYGLFTPRMKRAHLEGRSPEATEIAADILSNALYAIPAGQIAKPAQVLATKLPGVLAKAGNKAAGAASQFAVPFTVYGMDKALGNETDIYDPLLGGLANMGVNKVLAPALGRFGSVVSGKISSRLPGPLREALEGAQSPQQKARELIENAKRTVQEIRQPEKEYENAFKRGIGSGGKWDRINEAEHILEVADFVDDVAPNVKRQLDDAVRFGKELRKEGKNAGDMMYSPEEYLAREIALVDNPGPVNFADEVIKGVVDKDTELFKKHPELMTLFMKEPSLFSKPTLSRPTLEGVLDGLMAFGVNKYGGDQTGANVAAQALTGGLLDPKEIRKDQKKARTKKRQASEAEQILKPRLEGLTGKDREYLQAIIDNPGLVQGYGNVTQEFRNWFLLRGQDLLSGTKYFRPAPEVE